MGPLWGAANPLCFAVMVAGLVGGADFGVFLDDLVDLFTVNFGCFSIPHAPSAKVPAIVMQSSSQTGRNRVARRIV